MTADTQPLSGHPVLEAPLTGATLIEASAGTGKTSTIVGLWLRLVVERSLDPRAILVVTFTEAATAELKERIRAALFALRAALDGGPIVDPIVGAVVGGVADDARDAVRARVRHAAEALDEAAVFTIHGFCQRLLGDHAFSGGGPFEVTLRQSQAESIVEVARDFWRRLVGGLRHDHDATLRALVAAGGSPDKLVSSCRLLIGHRLGAVLRPPAHDLRATIDALDQAAAAARQFWDRARVESKVLSKVLNANVYRADSMRRRCAEVDRWLQRAVLPLEAPDRFDLFTTTKIVECTKKGNIPPRDDFFDAATALQAAATAAETAAADAWRSTLADFVEWAGPELKRRKAAEGWQHFDDLLADVHAALDSARGEGLARSVGARFGAALIDEFQDTDETQYAILSRLFARVDAALFLVGDPKQAIYGFRGADVHTYLAARGDTSTRFALEVNRRSSPTLIAAVNSIFGRGPASFMMPGSIGFAPAGAPAERAPALDAGDAHAPFVVWHVPGTFKSPRDKGDVGESIVRATADEVARLLGRLPTGSRPATLRDRDGTTRPLRGGDIAILVGRHVESGPMRSALAGHGIATVTYGDESVLASPEAADLVQLLAALVRPGDDRIVRAALGTRLFGWPLERVLAAEAGGTLTESAWEDTLEQFGRWSDALARSGPVGVYRDIVRQADVPARLLGAVDGDRALTNYGQLAELLQTAWRDGQKDAASLLRHLVRAMDDDTPGVEETQLRLESDEALVRVMTVHMAKGLEFPVVFCPTLWDSNRKSARPKPPFRFHGAGHGDAMAIEFGSPDLDAHAGLRTVEDLAERVRVTYVALTRARERCYLVWGAMKEAHKGALAWLLHGPVAAVPDVLVAMEALEERLKGLSQEALRGEVDALAAASDGAISVCELPAPAAVANAGVPVRAVGAAAPFPGRVPAARRLSSFTSIVAAGEADAPDHDAAIVERVVDDRPPADDILGFPRGAAAGSCLHAVMEALLARDVASRGEVTGIAAREAAAFGIDAQAAPALARMATELLRTPLDATDPFHLGGIAPERCAIEMEFHIPVEAIAPDPLRAVVALHRAEAGLPEGTSPVDAHAIGAGYLKGYVDLVFEHRDRYWVVDYKSNWLGPTLDHYRHENMAASIVAEQYDLQYLLYTLAVDRLLAQRVRGYDYDMHFGGVLYLYARGMRVENGPARGVYRARPSAGVVDALRALWP